MKIQYTPVKNINLNFDLSIIDYIKKLTITNTRSLEIWKNAKFSLIDDKNNVVWIKEFKDITQEACSASANKE